MSDQKLQAAIFITAILTGVFMVLGCSSTNGPPPPTIPDIPPAATNAVGTHGTVVGIFCGLTETSPDGDNDCPGCDVDARGLFIDARGEGVNPLILLNAECTWANIKKKVFAVAEGLVEGDMLVLGHSGHGMQIPDDNGDEEDGKDEALVLYRRDGTTETVDIVRDDRVMDELLIPLWQAHPGLDIFLITDTCHSQGNFRALWNWARRTDPRQLELFSPAEIQATARVVKGALIQIAMCRENSYSYGTAFGGTGTQCLLRARKGTVGRRDAFLAMLPLIDTDQVPQWVEYGDVSEMFRDGEFWK